MFLNNVFQRSEEKQDNKMNEELKSEIENKKVSLKNSQLKRGSNLN